MYVDELMLILHRLIDQGTISQNAKIDFCSQEADYLRFTEICLAHTSFNSLSIELSCPVYDCDGHKW